MEGTFVTQNTGNCSLLGEVLVIMGTAIAIWGEYTHIMKDEELLITNTILSNYFDHNCSSRYC